MFLTIRADDPHTDQHGLENPNPCFIRAIPWREVNPAPRWTIRIQVNPYSPATDLTIIRRDKLGTHDFAKTIAVSGVTCLADIEDSSMCEQPLGLNYPWLLLHLATAADYAASLLGGLGVCPAD